VRWHGFLVLPENRSAARAVRSMCRAIRAAKRPTANPLVLHGPPGAGKSQLMAAVANHLATAPGANGSGNGFTAQLVSVGDLARSPDAGLADRDLFDCDLLALEDVQHLRDRTADGACDLIDHRVARRRATVVTTTAGPAGLTHLPRRLTSRLAGGLVVRLETLSAASRRTVLADAAVTRGVRLTGEALDYLAERAAGGGVRAALGWLQNLAQVARAFPGPLGRADVAATLAETGQPTSAGVDVSTIVKRVAAAFGVGEADLLGPSRLRTVLRPRQVAMHLARELTGLSRPRLGAAFGGRDHTTVLHACRKVEEDMRNDPELAKRVSELRAALG
jgi:chromosomal replication initiator protein